MSTREVPLDFSDRHVVVTGGTGGLGVAVVGSLLDRGAICHVPCRASAAATDHPQRQHARLRLVATDSLATERAVETLYGTLPGLWASIHLAGAYAFAGIGETSAADLDRLIEANFISTFLCSRAAVTAMRTSGGGRIVNVAARPAIEWRLGAGMTAYAATKAAVAALTVALAQEVAMDGILVNAVAPSIIDTAANRRDMPKADHRDWPTPEEIAATILFLASPGNTVTRGAVVPVYGRT
jgi:NAD(P)-dependent dehydrogenase (short-subunit alcohol dehydrogenase family)